METISSLIIIKVGLPNIDRAEPLAGGRYWRSCEDGMRIYGRLGGVTAKQAGEPLKEVGWP